MKKTTSFENIGWGKFANAKIIIEEFYTPSNDFDYTHISVVTEEFELHEITTDSLYEGLLAVTDEETANWLFEALNGDMIRFVKKELKREQHNEYANMLQRFKEEKNEK